MTPILNISEGLSKGDILNGELRKVAEKIELCVKYVFQMINKGHINTALMKRNSFEYYFERCIYHMQLSLGSLIRLSFKKSWIVYSVLISVHIRFNLERYLLNTWKIKWENPDSEKVKFWKLVIWFWFYAQQKKNTSFDSTNIILSAENAFTKTTYIYWKRNERILCMFWLISILFLERFLNEPHSHHCASSLFYCYIPPHLPL